MRTAIARDREFSPGMIIMHCNETVDERMSWLCLVGRELGEGKAYFNKSVRFARISYAMKRNTCPPNRNLDE